MNDELLKLAAAADSAETPAPEDNPAGDATGDAGTSAPPPISNAQVVTGTVAMMREVFCMYTKLDSPRRVITDQRALDLGGAWGPVCDKHGWNLSEWLGDYMLEATAVMVTFTILGEVRAAVQAEIAAKKAAEKPADKPEADTIDAAA